MSKESPPGVESYHHIKYKKPENRSVVIKIRVTDALDKILTKDSPEVTRSGGFFIWQKNGQYSLMFGKNFFIQPDYIKLLGMYMAVSGYCMTLEAKQAFESGEKDAIRELIKRARSSNNQKKHGGKEWGNQYSSTPIMRLGR